MKVCRHLPSLHHGFAQHAIKSALQFDKFLQNTN